MKEILNTRFWNTVLIALMIGTMSGCTTFKRHDPSPVGIFYPNYPIQGVYFTMDDFWKSENKISFSQPAKIKAVGRMTWNSLMGEYYETALISPKLDHLPEDYWINTEGDYYATISWLQANGRIEYTGSKTSSDYFWEGVGRFLTSTIGIILELIVIIVIIILFNVKKSSHVSSYSDYRSSSDSYSTSSSYDSDYSHDSDEESSNPYESKSDRDVEYISHGSSTRRCRDCQSIDLSLSFTEKGNGRCKECDGTGHDRHTEALVRFGTLGLENNRYDCKTCSGTGQCQTCGGTGIVYD
jgi:hypothetical protein